MIELGQILDGLVQRTTDGKLKWKQTVPSDRFVTSVDAISIVIMESQDFPVSHYRLDILDEYGDIADSLGYRDTTDEQDRQLERLYVLARRSAHKVDLTLEKLAKALEL